MKKTNEKVLLDDLQKVRKAQKEFAKFTQEQVDAIFFAAAKAGNENRIMLAEMAVEETGMGIVEDKIIKNHVASEFVYNKYKDTKTVGLIEEDLAKGTEIYSEPVGVIATVIPTTNPTSTAIFKTLIALKSRNAIFLAPHPRAKKCTIKAAELLINAAEEAGAPKGLLGFIGEVDKNDDPIKLTNTLMAEADLILATGGPGMVKAAYSSGTPAIGVGAGNVSVLVDNTADIDMAAASIIHSKSFDFGVICASEQSIVAHKDVYASLKAKMKEYGAYFLNQEEIKKVRKIILKNGVLNAGIVGQDPQAIAKLAKITIPEWTRIIVGEVTDTSEKEPFAHEKLSVILAMYKASDSKKAMDMCNEMITHGGLGHTAGIYADEVKAKDLVKEYVKLVPTARVVVNTPTAHGGVGDVYNFGLAPSLTLGCGSWGGNSVSENIGPSHLLNKKTVAKRRENMLWMQIPSKVYHKFGCLPVALSELQDKKKVFIVTDKGLFDLGFTDKITKELDKYGTQYTVFGEVDPDPTIDNVMSGVNAMNNFQPDCIIALGGGSAMDAAKIMWLYYEYPEANFKDMALTFIDVKKRVYRFPELGKKAFFVCVPTTSGTGSEVTPFSVITDTDGTKYPLADYALTPDMAIVDAELTMLKPAAITSASGIDVFTHAIESYVSIVATEYTMPYSLKSAKLVTDNLKHAYKEGKTNIEARSNMATASCMAGMAFGNAFLGICHSMAHKLGAKFHIPHGVANALLLSEVIKYNATNRPYRQATFSQYHKPEALTRYAEFATYLGISGKDENTKVEKLIEIFDKLRKDIDIPLSIKDYGINEKEFTKAVKKMAKDAFDDQCTGANPRYPLIKDLEEIYLRSYYGKDYKGTKTYSIGK